MPPLIKKVGNLNQERADFLLATHPRNSRFLRIPLDYQRKGGRSAPDAPCSPLSSVKIFHEIFTIFVAILSKNG